MDEYVYWLQEQVEHSGGTLASEYLRVIHVQDDMGNVVGFQVLRDRLVFKETVLTIRITIDEEMQDEEYNFHFQHKNGTLIFRKDRQPGHPECGSLEHIHRDPADPDAAEAFQRVDIAEVLEEVHRYHQTGALP